MNEPGFRFCGGCGSRQQDSVVPAASQVAGGGGANGGGASFGSSIGTGQEQGLAPAGLGTDGAGAPALVAPRPRRSSGMSSSLVVPGRSRMPLVALLVVDLGLAIGGGLLLRAGLAKPAVAAAGEPSPSSTTKGAAPGAEAPSGPGASAAPGAGAPSDASAASAGGATPAPASAAPAASSPSPSRAAASRAPSGERESSDSKPVTADSKQTPPAANAKREAPPPKRAKGSSASNAIGETINPYTPLDPPSSTKPGDSIKKQVDAAIRKSKRALDDCYIKIVKRAGAASLAVSYRVTMDGRLSEVRPMSTLPDGELLMSCVRTVTSRWKVTPGNPDELMVSTIKFGEGR